MTLSMLPSCINTDIEELRGLLKLPNANASEAFSTGWSCLHIAVKNQRLDIVRLLLENGADLHAQNTRQVTPLHSATERGVRVIAEELLNAGARRDLVDDRDRTPADLARVRGYENLAVFIDNGG